MIESTPDRFKSELGDTDIAIDSNVLLYHDDVDNNSLIWDVYRSHKNAPMR